MTKNIGEIIRFRRQQLHMSQDELARKLGYKGRSSINKIEASVNGLPLDMVSDLARALNTTEVYLLGIVDDPNWRMPENVPVLTDKERIMIDRYRSADEEVQKMVDYLLR